MEARPRPFQPQRKTHSPELTGLSTVVGALACALVFIIPFLPDEKLTRIKLEALEIGVFSLALVVGAQYFLSRIWRVKSIVAAVAAWAFINTGFWLFSAEKSLATPELRRVLLAAAAFLAFALGGLTETWKRRVLVAWTAAGTLVAAYGILQFNGGLGPIAVPQMDRIMGPFGNSIFFAAFLVPSIFVSLEVLTASSKKKFLILIGIAVQLAALYLTRTRAAWIALIVAGAIAFSRRTTFEKIPAWFWLLTVLFGGIFVYGTKSVWTRDQAHLLIWRDTLRMWKSHPMAGIGLGAFHTNFPAFAGDDLKSKWPSGKVIINEAHNEYLQTLAETGLIGLLAFLAVPVLFFYRRTDWSWPVLGVAALLIENLFSVDMRFGISFANCFMLMGLLSIDNSAREPHPLLITRARIGAALVWIAGLCLLVLPALLKPYRAQRLVSTTPNFFDERLLDPAKSIGDLEKLREQFPMEPAVLEKLGYVYAKEIKTRDGRIDEQMAAKAADTYQALLRGDPTRVAAYNNLANIYYTLGRTDDAVSMWRKAADIKPDFIDAQLNLGKILYTQGKLKEAAQRFETVLRLDPNNAEAIVYLKRMVE